jgi:hypothetical protein
MHKMARDVQDAQVPRQICAADLDNALRVGPKG